MEEQRIQLSESIQLEVDVYLIDMCQAQSCHQHPVVASCLVVNLLNRVWQD